MNASKHQRAAFEALKTFVFFPKGTLLRIITRTGKYVLIDTSRGVCSHFGFYFLQRVTTNEGPATVLGVGKSSNPAFDSNFLYVILDKDDGASFWDNAKEYSHLVNDCGFSLENPSSPVPNNVVKNLVRAMNLDKINFTKMIHFELKLVDDHNLDYFKRREELFLFFPQVPRPSSNFTAPSSTSSKPAKEEPKVEFQRCPTCNQLFLSSAIESHIGSCVPPEPLVPIDKLRIQSLDLFFDDFNNNSNTSRNERVPKLKVLVTRILESEISTEYSNEELLILFGHAYKMSNQKLLKLIIQLLKPRIPNLWKTDSIVKIIGKQLTQALILIWLSSRDSLPLSQASELMEFSIEQNLEEVQKALKNLTNSSLVFETLEKSEDFPEVQNLCMRKFESMSLNEIINAPKFKQLPEYIQRKIEKISTDAVFVKKDELLDEDWMMDQESEEDDGEEDYVTDEEGEE